MWFIFAFGTAFCSAGEPLSGASLISMSKGLPILHKLPKFSTDFFHKSLPSTGTEFEKYSTATKYYEADSTDLQLNRKNHKPPLF